MSFNVVITINLSLSSCMVGLGHTPSQCMCGLALCDRAAWMGHCQPASLSKHGSYCGGVRGWVESAESLLV